MKKLFQFVMAALLVAPPALAQQTRVYNESGNWTQEITGTLGSARSLHVQVEVGAVKVYGGSQQGITYEVHNNARTSSEDRARREFDQYKVSVSMRGDTAWIEGEWENGHPHNFSGEFIINVPREMESVKIETDGGSVVVKDIAGRVETQSGGGDIRLSGVGGAINSETGGGNIEVGDAGSQVTLETGGGTIKVASAKGTVNAQSGGGSIDVTSCLQGAELDTGGGNIHLDHCSGPVKASTGGGSIYLGEVGGPVEMETGAGSIRLTSAKGTVRAETGGGCIELNGISSAHAETGAGSIVARFVSAGDRKADSTLETSAGDITVYLAPNLNLTVRATVEVGNGHGIHTDFPEIKVDSEGGEWGPKTITAEGSLNGGGQVLKIATTTGDIFIRRGQ